MTYKFIPDHPIEDFHRYRDYNFLINFLPYLFFLNGQEIDSYFCLKPPLFSVDFQPQHLS